MNKKEKATIEFCLLYMVYVGYKKALNNFLGYYDGLKQEIEQLQQENKQLKEDKNKVTKKKEVKNK